MSFVACWSAVLCVIRCNLETEEHGCLEKKNYSEGWSLHSFCAWFIVIKVYANCCLFQPPPVLKLEPHDIGAKAQEEWGICNWRALAAEGESHGWRGQAAVRIEWYREYANFVLLFVLFYCNHICTFLNNKKGKFITNMTFKTKHELEWLGLLSVVVFWLDEMDSSFFWHFNKSSKRTTFI